MIFVYAVTFLLLLHPSDTIRICTGIPLDYRTQHPTLVCFTFNALRSSVWIVAHLRAFFTFTQKAAHCLLARQYSDFWFMACESIHSRKLADDPSLGAMACRVVVKRIDGLFCARGIAGRITRIILDNQTPTEEAVFAQSESCLDPICLVALRIWCL